MVPDRIEASLKEHQAIVEAIKQHDMETAVTLLFNHRINTLLALVQAIKYALMTPNYKQQDLLKNFFLEEQLDNRTALIGEIQYWDFILDKLV